MGSARGQLHTLRKLQDVTRYGGPEGNLEHSLFALELNGVMVLTLTKRWLQRIT